MERLSVHIVSKDRPTELAICLTSLYNQSFKDWDLIVVDDCSRIPYSKHYYIHSIINRMKYDGHGVKFLRNEVSNGVAAARNTAVDVDNWNEYCVRVDDDSLMDVDYLQRLYDIVTGEVSFEGVKPSEIGGVGGVVPNLVSPEHCRDSNLFDVFNKITYSPDGELSFADDGGLTYIPGGVMLSHHLRSSFLFRKSAFKAVGGFPGFLGHVSFTEETWFCLKLLYEGYVLLTDTDAKCWHLRSPGGGCRASDYKEQVEAAREKFSYHFKNRFKREGLPFVHEVYKK